MEHSRAHLRDACCALLLLVAVGLAGRWCILTSPSAACTRLGPGYVSFSFAEHGRIRMLVRMFSPEIFLLIDPLAMQAAPAG